MWLPPSPPPPPLTHTHLVDEFSKISLSVITDRSHISHKEGQSDCISYMMWHTWFDTLQAQYRIPPNCCALPSEVFPTYLWHTGLYFIKCEINVWICSPCTRIHRYEIYIGSWHEIPARNTSSHCLITYKVSLKPQFFLTIHNSPAIMT